MITFISNFHTLKSSISVTLILLLGIEQVKALDKLIKASTFKQTSPLLIYNISGAYVNYCD